MFTNLLSTFGETVTLTDEQAATLLGALFAVLASAAVIYILIIIGGWKIFTKAGEKGWKTLIPIYNLYIVFKICGIKNWFWYFMCATIVASIITNINVPPEITAANTNNTEIDFSAIDWSQYPTYIIGTVLSGIVALVEEIVIAIRLSKAFKKGVGFTLGLIFLPYIFVMILGFGEAKYDKKAIKA